MHWYLLNINNIIWCDYFHLCSFPPDKSKLFVFYLISSEKGVWLADIPHNKHVVAMVTVNLIKPHHSHTLVEKQFITLTADIALLYCDYSC